MHTMPSAAWEASSEMIFILPSKEQLLLSNISVKSRVSNNLFTKDIKMEVTFKFSGLPIISIPCKYRFINIKSYG